MPARKWGWFKVPGCWPGITDYMQKDCQAVFAYPSWRTQNRGGLSAAWYQRKITVPRDRADRRVAARAEHVNMEQRDPGPILFGKRQGVT